MSKPSARQALSRLARQKHDAKAKAFQDLVKEVNCASDRTNAVIFGSLVEDALRSAIMRHFQTLSPDDEEKIFSGLGPLSTFTGKILIAYAMGVITRPQRHDLEYIKDIRNAFAHDLVGLSFANKEIIDACVQLTLLNSNKLPHHQQTADWRFRLSCVILMRQLSEKYLNIYLSSVPIDDLIATEPHSRKV